MDDHSGASLVFQFHAIVIKISLIAAAKKVVAFYVSRY